MNYLKDINQHNEILKHFTFIDENEPTIKHEEVSSTILNSNQTASENQKLSRNKSFRQADDSEGSQSSFKKVKVSGDDSDDEEDDENEEQRVRACQVFDQRSSIKKFFIPKSAGKSMKIKEARTLAHDVQKKLNISITTKNLNTLDDVKQYLTALPNKTQGRYYNF